MVGLGIAALVVGVVLLVAEAHVPTAGVLGVLGALALGAGGWLLLDAAGAAVAVAVALGATLGVVALAAVLLAGSRVITARRIPARGDLARLVGQTGVVRTWQGRGGQVQLGGTLWRARLELGDEEEPPALGQPVVVLRVEGLTMSVRRCEAWEAE